MNKPLIIVGMDTDVPMEAVELMQTTYSKMFPRYNILLIPGANVVQQIEPVAPTGFIKVNNE